MTKPTVRCAVYTRKSSEEGLEQDFNSLDAQREACQAFIASQRHEGWQALPETYDDGGVSGGTLERPAVQRLMAAIRSDKVDVVVVYKVDRLTRALSDFARLVEIFDHHGVSFVSVTQQFNTQQFNTTTSMGRLTLNVLLSFAQFEREVTGERIRDKIAASKKKGMWMGGHVPLGYDAKDRSLIVNEPEAATVRALFDLYLEHGCVRRVYEAARDRGLTTKLRQSADGSTLGGRPLSRGYIYKVLNNPLYAGRIAHKGKVYDGQHGAIVARETWNSVQERLAQNRVDRRDGKTAREPSLLAGKLFDDTGHPFTPSHAVKNGRRYRYYIERIEDHADGRQPRRKRIAATEIESLVTSKMIQLLRSPRDVIDAAQLAGSSAELVRATSELAKQLAGRFECDPAQRHKTLRALVARVALAEDTVAIHVDRTALLSALECQTVEGSNWPHVITVGARLRARGVELKLLIDGPNDNRQPEPDAVLIKAIVRAHEWWSRLASGEAPTIREIAKSEGASEYYVRRILDLAFLAPNVTAAILDGRQPPDLTVQRLLKSPHLPISWSEQCRLLGTA
jgi:site-specific DNA recombinase